MELLSSKGSLTFSKNAHIAGKSKDEAKAEYIAKIAEIREYM